MFVYNPVNAQNIITEKVKRCTGIVNFFDGVNDKSILLLISGIDYLRLTKNCNDILINIKTDGGDTTAGIAAYNYLSSISETLTIRTHNIGVVSSAGNLIYCGGKIRTATKHSKFLVHNGDLTINGNFTPSDLSEIIRNWEGNRKISQEIFSICTGLDENKVADIRDSRSVFTASQALDIGLVQKITASPEVLHSNYLEIYYIGLPK